MMRRATMLLPLPLPLTLLLLLAALPLSARAASCSVSGQPLSFGNYDPLSLTATDAVGQVAVSCTSVLVSIPYQLSLSAGTSGSFSGRQMASGANRLGYNLYSDVLHLIVWGDGTGGSVTVTGTITTLTTSNNVTVYGRIAARQNVSVGTYSDTITVTVQY